MKNKSLNEQILQNIAQKSTLSVDPESAGSLTQHRIHKKLDLGVDLNDERDDSIWQKKGVTVQKGVQLRDIDQDSLGERYKGKKVSRHQLFSQAKENYHSSSSQDDLDDDYQNSELEESQDSLEDTSDNLELGDDMNGFSSGDQEGDSSSQNDDDDSSTILKSKEMLEASKLLEELQNDEEQKMEYPFFFKFVYFGEKELDKQFQMMRFFGLLMREIKRQKSQTEETKKATQVSNQTRLWKNLLETRIRLQKPLALANSFPPFDKIGMFQEQPEVKSLLGQIYDETADLLNELIDLKEDTMAQCTESYQKKKIRKVEKTEDCWDLIKNIDNSYQSEMENIINHWNSRVELISGKQIRDKQKNLSTLATPLLEQISHFLADKHKLRKRTQLKRSPYRIFGKSKSSEKENVYEEEIFDDTDFYQTLLTDIVRSSNNAPVGSEWKKSDAPKTVSNSVNFQKMNVEQFKKVRKQDLIRRKMLSFEPIQPLVGFMAPIEEPAQRDWSESLAESLFQD